jgi:hypothetical protein
VLQQASDDGKLRNKAIASAVATLSGEASAEVAIVGEDDDEDDEESDRDDCDDDCAEDERMASARVGSFHELREAFATAVEKCQQL